ncbi:nitroreductase family protein [Qingshengfaniella alkalisoli]|uniref:Putative NAD(P)H nitroreductase n=1 Tax=Qingshengfaniella alkalisoli TaxID=2599296 RepID=A0A5B8IW19_9RHOB|nr:nitroreductase [Qingshengfaniella alkalisoli]QDY69834.1 nitroreductase [Qingshengfaniella alkalisoli]
MPKANPAALDFLLTRRSRPAKTLSAPFPDRAALETILTAAARTPDHGKLEPWRFIVLQGDALTRLADLVPVRGSELDLPEDKITKMRDQFTMAGCVVAVIEVQKPSDKVPAIEQTYSAGAVCLSLLNAALASGWGANWLTGWASLDRGFVEQGLGLMPNESVAGFIHLGTESNEPPDRPRPNLPEITQWVDV